MYHNDLNKQNIYNIDEYWKVVFKKDYKDVIEEHERCIKFGKPSRLENAFNYQKERLYLHTKLYSNRVYYIWVIESVFLTTCTYLFSKFNNDNINDTFYMILFISFFGLITTFIWLQTLKGAKFCEENAEKHIMMLEEHIIGNINKTIWIDPQKTQSISHSNDYLCYMFLFVWFILGIYCTYKINYIILCVFCFIIGIRVGILFIKNKQRINISEINTFKY